MTPTDITGELLLAYELSLAVGQTLDPHATCRDFLRILVARRNLIGASKIGRASCRERVS
jgi:hypothetical protein